jgi:hypothetical protein
MEGRVKASQNIDTKPRHVKENFNIIQQLALVSTIDFNSPQSGPFSIFPDATTYFSLQDPA